MLVDVDDREDGKVLELMRANGMLPFKKRLKIGDYIYNEVCCERKTIDDFCLSIMDGRIQKQVENMQVFKHKFVLISGNLKDKKEDIHPHCALAMMASIAIRAGITVLSFDTDEDLFYCMSKIFEKYDDEKIKEKEKVF